MKTTASVLASSALASMMLVTGVTFGDDKAACVDASLEGQKLRNDHKLVEARAQLRACAAAACPAVVQGDCATWLAEVDRALPTVVVTAKNRAGADLVDVRVSADGQPLGSRLDGQALPMNPGPHTFHFEGADGTSLDQLIVVKEGEKAQAVAVVLGSPPPDHPATGAASPVEPSSPWKTVGWVLGGLGVAGLGVGTVFGIVTMSDKTSAHCDAGNVCDPGTTGGIRTAALVSDVGWIAGGVLLSGGAALILLAPEASRDAAARLQVAPVVTASGGAIVAGGSW